MQCQIYLQAWNPYIASDVKNPPEPEGMGKKKKTKHFDAELGEDLYC